MGKALVMIHGRGPGPEHDALLACWTTFIDAASLSRMDTRDMVDWVALWGYQPTYQPVDEAGCEKVALIGNPDAVAEAALQELSTLLKNGTHLSAAPAGLAWPDIEKLKDDAVEALWRRFAQQSGNQFAIDVLNFFKDRPEIRINARQQLKDAIDAARSQGHEVMVLAHSFGTIAAYEAARAYQHQEIDTLVTMGCPLAWCYDIWRPAAPPPEGYHQAKVFPNLGLQHWANIYDPLDPVATAADLAAVPHLAPGYLDGGKQVVLDVALSNPYAQDDDWGSHHDWRGYLESEPVTQALQRFLA